MGGYIPLFSASGNSSNYAMLRSLTTGKVWNGAAMESWNQSHWATYDVAAPEDAGSGCYVVAVPGALPADLYQAVLYLPAAGDGTPASGDSAQSTEIFDWDGANVSWLGSGVNITKISGSATAADNLESSALAFVKGAAAAGTLSTSQMTTDLGATVADIYAGRVLYFTSGVNAGLVVLITAYAVTGGKLTFIAYGNQSAPSAPSAADTFIIF